MEPWYKIAEPCKEAREGRSFNPNRFAIALEQVIDGKAPEDKDLHRATDYFKPYKGTRFAIQGDVLAEMTELAYRIMEERTDDDVATD